MIFRKVGTGSVEKKRSQCNFKCKILFCINFQNMTKSATSQKFLNKNVFGDFIIQAWRQATRPQIPAHDPYSSKLMVAENNINFEKNKLFTPSFFDSVSAHKRFLGLILQYFINVSEPFICVSNGR